MKAAAEKLRGDGWRPEGKSFEIPEGPCYRFNDPSGNALAIPEIVRPGVLGISGWQSRKKSLSLLPDGLAFVNVTGSL